LPPRLVFYFDQQTSREAGCNGFVPKPIREEELQQLRVHLGLEWVYEEALPSYRPKRGRGEAREYFSLRTQDSGRTLRHRLLQESLVAPPAEEIAALFDLAMMGDLRGIVERTTRLEQLDRNGYPTHLRQLAKGFEENKSWNLSI